MGRLAGYGVGDFGLNIYWNTIALFLVFFYTVAVGLPPDVAGTIYFVGMVWDALSDPIVANLAERVRTKQGTYRPFLLYGSGLVGLAFVFLFWVPPFEGMALLVFLVVMGIIFRTCYTLVAIPYAALSARLTFDSGERVELTGVRMFFAFGGLLAVSGLFPILLRRFSGGGETDPAAFALAAAVGAVTATAAILLCFARTKEEPLMAGTRNPALSPLQLLKTFWANKALLILLIAVFLQSSGNASLMVSMLFFLETQPGLASQETVLTAFAIATMIGVPIWTVVIRHLGRKKSWLLGASLIAGFGLSMLTFGPFAVMGLPIPILGYGFCMGAFGVMLWSFVPDTVEFGQVQTGKRAEGISFGAVLISQKLAGAAMGFMVGQVLSFIGFDAAAEVQTAQTSADLLVFLSIVPGIGYFVSAIPVLILPIDRERHADMVSTLSKPGSAKG